MGRKHSADEILEAAVDTAFAEGLSRISFGRVAARLGISDRTVVYYFPSKHDLITEVLLTLGGRLQASLEPAFRVRAANHRELLRAAWPAVTTAEADAVFALYFEAVGLAAAGQEPYRSLVPQLVDGWISWAAAQLDVEDEVRQSEAEAAIATIDGLLMIRQLTGPDAADRAAHRLLTNP